MKFFRLGGRERLSGNQDTIQKKDPVVRSLKLPPPSSRSTRGASTLRDAGVTDLPKAIEIIQQPADAAGALDQARSGGEGEPKFRVIRSGSFKDVDGEFENVVFHECRFAEGFEGSFRNCFFVMCAFEETRIDASFESCFFIGANFIAVQLINFDAGSWSDEGRNFFLQSSFTSKIAEHDQSRIDALNGCPFETITVTGREREAEQKFLTIPTLVGHASFVRAVAVETNFMALRDMDPSSGDESLWFDNAALFGCQIIPLPRREIVNAEVVRSAFKSVRSIGYDMPNLPKIELTNIDLIDTFAQQVRINASIKHVLGFDSVWGGSRLSLHNTENLDFDDAQMADCLLSVFDAKYLRLRDACLHGSFARVTGNIRRGLEQVQAGCTDFRKAFQTLNELLTQAEAPRSLTRWYDSGITERTTRRAYDGAFFAALESAAEEGRTPGACRLVFKGIGDRLSAKHAPKEEKELTEMIADRDQLKQRVTGDSSLVLTNADLTGASLSGADLSLTDLSGVTLDHADLSGADLRGVVAAGGSSAPMRMNQARLDGARMAGAVLDGASFAETSMANVSFAEEYGGRVLFASVRRTNFSEATGLIGTEFTGLDLSGAKLPDEIKDFGALATIHTLSIQARNILLIQFLAAIYVVLTLLNLSEGGEGASITLPVLGVEAPRQIFGIGAGAALLAAFAYLHSKLGRIWVEISRLPSLFPDKRSAGRHIYPFLLTAIAEWLRPSARPVDDPAREASGINALIERLGAIVAGWLLAPLTLAAMLLIGDGESQRNSLVLMVMLGLSAAIAISSWVNAVLQLRVVRYRPRV